MREDRLVYSTDSGKIPSEPGRRPASRAPKARAAPVLPSDGVVRIFRERGRRGGKPLTVVRGLPGRTAELEARTLALKRLCGAGGAVRDGAIEIQGDHRERIADLLRAEGYRVKLAGG